MNNKNTLNRRRFLAGSSTILGASTLSPLSTIVNSALGNHQNVVINSDKPDYTVPVLTGNEFDLYVSKKKITVHGQSKRITLTTLPKALMRGRLRFVLLMRQGVVS